MQNCGHSSAIALELLQSCIKPSIQTSKLKQKGDHIWWHMDIWCYFMTWQCFPYYWTFMSSGQWSGAIVLSLLLAQIDSERRVQWPVFSDALQLMWLTVMKTISFRNYICIGHWEKSTSNFLWHQGGTIIQFLAYQRRVITRASADHEFNWTQLNWHWVYDAIGFSNALAWQWYQSEHSVSYRCFFSIILDVSDSVVLRFHNVIRDCFLKLLWFGSNQGTHSIKRCLTSIRILNITIRRSQVLSL